VENTRTSGKIEGRIVREALSRPQIYLLNPEQDVPLVMETEGSL
jgi:hypothetical protein